MNEPEACSQAADRVSKESHVVYYKEDSNGEIPGLRPGPDVAGIELPPIRQPIVQTHPQLSQLIIYKQERKMHIQVEACRARNTALLDPDSRGELCTDSPPALDSAGGLTVHRDKQSHYELLFISG